MCKDHSNRLSQAWPASGALPQCPWERWPLPKGSRGVIVKVIMDEKPTPLDRVYSICVSVKDFAGRVLAILRGLFA